MSSVSRVLHRVAKPIAVEEFLDAVRAACPPDYPTARATGHRQVGRQWSFPHLLSTLWSPIIFGPTIANTQCR